MHFVPLLSTLFLYLIYDDQEEVALRVAWITYQPILYIVSGQKLGKKQSFFLHKLNRLSTNIQFSFHKNTYVLESFLVCAILLIFFHQTQSYHDLSKFYCCTLKYLITFNIKSFRYFTRFYYDQCFDIF